MPARDVPMEKISAEIRAKPFCAVEFFALKNLYESTQVTAKTVS